MATSLAPRLPDKRALITGGASGIGLATARRFVAEGARVVIGDLDADRLDAVATELGSAVVTRRCDVRVEGDVEALTQTAVDELGGLDIAFANAGIGSFAPILAVDAAEWMNVIEVNLLGPLLTVKHAGQRLTDGGSIIVTASLNAVQAAGGMSAYCCSKAALAMLAEVAAMELGPRRIRVNSIGPGLVRTPLTEAMWLLPQLVTEFDENAPVATHTSPDDVANLVTFLASDESASISGQLHLVDRAAHTKRYPDMLGLLS
ncbi:MAG TPA: SDR family oxidoreductase [Acidimicrobiales bacterium]|jgi:NAD(P)-dependent dehydrogenase (short-subunit alcohol dehydrogenase family)|nr:SDR family oxidoreductase [Acidimicrobiales bacterium]